MPSHQDCSHEKKQKQNKTKQKTNKQTKIIKNGALEEKLKIGELTPEASFAEKKHATNFKRWENKKNRRVVKIKGKISDLWWNK